MVAFKFLLSLTLVAVALAADEPQIAFAEVELSGPSEMQMGKPFALTCKFNATLPKSTDESSLGDTWTAEVSFFRGVGMLKSLERTPKDGYSSSNKYITENYFEGINVYPTTDTSGDTNGQVMRTEYSVVVLLSKSQSMSMSSSNGLQCAVTLHKGYMDSNWDQAGVRYTSNTLKYNL